MSGRRRNRGSRRRPAQTVARMQQRRGRGARPYRPVSEWTMNEISTGLADLWNVAKAGVSIFNTEVKMFDVPFQGGTPLNCPSTGSVSCLSLVPQGNDYNNREGLSLRTIMLSLNMNQNWNNTSNVTLNALLRVIVFVDYEQEGTIPAVTDVLESANINALYNHVAKERFQILFDRMVSGMTTRTNVPLIEDFRHDSHIQFRTNGSNQASQGEGSIYILGISDQAVNYPNVYGYTRLFYVDN